jgi:hypothetical protein
MRTRIVHRDNVLVLQPGDHCRLALERSYRLGIQRLIEGFTQSLYSNPSPEALVLGQPDLGHPAGTEQSLEAVSSINDI